MTGELFFQYLSSALEYQSRKPYAMVLNPGDRADISKYASQNMVYPPAESVSPITHVAGLRVYEAGWVDPGKMILLWNRDGRLEKLEVVNLCC